MGSTKAEKQLFFLSSVCAGLCVFVFGLMHVWFDVCVCVCVCWAGGGGSWCALSTSSEHARSSIRQFCMAS